MAALGAASSNLCETGCSQQGTSRAGWARWLAIIGVSVNAIGQVAFMANYPQAYPLWNIMVVALNILVLYALTAR